MLDIIRPLVALYITQLKDPYNYETDGPLGISVDRRSDFIYKYVVSTLDDWKTVQPIWDSTEILTDAENLILDEFVQKAYEKMHEFEVVAKDMVIGILEKGNDEIGRNL